MPDPAPCSGDTQPSGKGQRSYCEGNTEEMHLNCLDKGKRNSKIYNNSHIMYMHVHTFSVHMVYVQRLLAVCSLSVCVDGEIKVCPHCTTDPDPTGSIASALHHGSRSNWFNRVHISTYDTLNETRALVREYLDIAQTPSTKIVTASIVLTLDIVIMQCAMHTGLLTGMCRLRANSGMYLRVVCLNWNLQPRIATLCFLATHTTGFVQIIFVLSFSPSSQLSPYNSTYSEGSPERFPRSSLSSFPLTAEMEWNHTAHTIPHPQELRIPAAWKRREVRKVNVKEERKGK